MTNPDEENFDLYSFGVWTICLHIRRFGARSELNVPETKKIEVFDEYFGNTIVDPYRWLEDGSSDETGDWVDAQNAVTFEYLAGLKTVGDFKQS